MTRTTPEGKIAQKMIDLLSDIRLDLDMLGLYLAKIGTTTFFLRSERVFQSAEENLKPQTREEHYREMNRLGG